MKITKRQLKRIIREEYSKLIRKGLIQETSWGDVNDPWNPEADPGLVDKSFQKNEIILDYEKTFSDAIEVIIQDLQAGGLSVDPSSGIEVFEEQPGLISIAVKDEYQAEAVVDILGQPVAER